MERKGNKRNRVVTLRAVPKGDRLSNEGPVQEIVSVVLGDRMVFSEQAEVWTVRGMLRDGSFAREHIGELSFILIPGTQEPATAVVGFIAPQAPYVLKAPDDAIWSHVRNMVVQLGYDVEGFYASLSIGGRYAYLEDYRQER